MTPADLAALRHRACQLFAELGQALASLEDAEGLLSAPHAEALAYASLESAAAALDTASAHLADLAQATDRLTQSIAPSGVDADAS